jgi:hypothetical protein
MNVETLARTREEVCDEPRNANAATAPALPLAAVVAAIRRDALAEPVRYLDEVIVPYGGE